jgi:hypothetical protein
MKINKTYDWNIIGANLAAYLGNEQKNVQLKDTPFYPLTLHTEMPENTSFENGHLSFRFKDFSLNALNKISLNSHLCSIDGNRINIGIDLNDVTLKARYEINSKYASRINMDTAGNMQELDERSAREAGASDNGIEPLSPEEIDAMVEQARDQKTPIMGTINGPELMSMYNENNESYNSVFVISASLRTLWAEGGITTEMSRDTHVALNNDTVVNSPTKKYSNGYTYNINSGRQQLNVAFALDKLAQKALDDGNKILYEKYHKAALDTATFKETTNSTGGTQPANMTGSQVYATLNDPTKKLIKVSEAQFKNMLDQANDDGSKDGGADEEAVQNGWRVLGNDERKLIRERMFIFHEELMAIKEVNAELLWTGDCYSELKGTQVVITLIYDEQKSAWEINNSEIKLPAFSIEVDDSFWSGKAADLARERLSNMHFVKSLLQGKIESGIQSLLENAIVHVLSN